MMRVVTPEDTGGGGRETLTMEFLEGMSGVVSVCSTGSEDGEWSPLEGECWRETELREGEPLQRSPLVTGITEEFVDIEDVLGTGMDIVLLARDKLSARLVAVKRLSPERRTEVEIHQMVRHPAIVDIVTIFERTDQSEVDVVMEYVQGGDLFDYLSRKRSLSVAQARSIAEQILSALTYLHDHEIVHFDVKLENVLVTDAEEDGIKVKLCDFGISEMTSSNQKEALARVLMSGTRGFIKPSIIKTKKQNSVVGTRGYIAPELKDEINEDSLIGTPVDMYSLGVLMHVLLSGEFPDENHCPEAPMLDGQRWLGVSEDAKDFVRRLLSRNPLLRPTAAEALSHKWITGVSRQDRQDSLSFAKGKRILPATRKTFRTCQSSDDMLSSFARERRNSSFIEDHAEPFADDCDVLNTSPVSMISKSRRNLSGFDCLVP